MAASTSRRCFRRDTPLPRCAPMARWSPGGQPRWRRQQRRGGGARWQHRRHAGVFDVRYAFAALRADGSVVTWGYPLAMAATAAPWRRRSMAASTSRRSSRRIRLCGAARRWLGGHLGIRPLWRQQQRGGGGARWQHRRHAGLLDGYAFAALRADGSVVTWGGPPGGNSSAVAAASSMAASTSRRCFRRAGAFAALRADGSVVTWGIELRWRRQQRGGGQARRQRRRHAGVFDGKRLCGAARRWLGGHLGDPPMAATAARWRRRSMAASTSRRSFRRDTPLPRCAPMARWSPGETAPMAATAARWRRRSMAASTSRRSSRRNAFAALRADGSVVTWGYGSYGGDSSAVAAALDGSIDVTQVFSTERAFAALRADGSVVTWGDRAANNYGGDSSAVAAALDGSIDVTQVFSTDTPLPRCAPMARWSPGDRLHPMAATAARWPVNSPTW
jgi:hypothetical protein